MAHPQRQKTGRSAHRKRRSVRLLTLGPNAVPRSRSPGCQTPRMPSGGITRSLLVLIVAIAGACGTDAPPTATPPADADTPSSTTAAPDPTATAAADSDRLRWPVPLDELDPAQAAEWTVEIVDRFAHDATAFTQGLERLPDGSLIESTGLRGESTIRVVELASGESTRVVALPDDEFGEGATVVDDTIVQLTWQAGIAHRWSLPDLEPLPSWTYTGEGWGLCHLDHRLVMSDGTSTLTFRDATDFTALERITVRLDGLEVTRLNELECVDGHVLANVWQSGAIMVIRPDGAVVAMIDADALVAEVAQENLTREVLNGIALGDDGTLLLTGKLWPTVFAVEIEPTSPD